jgi:hypothetical protein
MGNGDKRSVSTDALETLGNVIDERAGRDAIHLAVEPVRAGERLLAGQNVGLVGGLAYATAACEKLGIVDPFLKVPIEIGQRFWLVVYPRQITSLRHVWTHPSFDAEAIVFDPKAESEKWLRDWCEQTGSPAYEQIVEAAQTGESGDYSDGYFYGLTYREGYFCTVGYQCDVRGIPSEFWKHLSIVTGKGFEPSEHSDYFSCSC